MSDDDKDGKQAAEISKVSASNQRRGHRAYVTRTLTKVDELLTDYAETQKSRLLSYRKSLEEKCYILDELNERVLLGLTEEEIEAEIIKSGDIKDDIQERLFRIDEQLDVKPETSMSASPLVCSQPPDNRSNARLPKLTLPNFSGNPIEYQSFWDSFCASVHNDPKLDNVVKFNYLKSVLRNPALSSISGLSLTSENYLEAVDILQKRYGNKQLLITSHMDKLLSIPSVTSLHDVGKLRNVYDEIEIHARNLKSLEVDTRQYGPALISIVMAKLPAQIKLVITRALSLNEKWDIEELLRVLKGEIESREMCYFMSSTTPCPKKDNSRHDNTIGKSVDEFTAASLVTDTKKSFPCVFCKRDNHSASRCTVITDTKARKSILRNKGRCFLCLRSSHVARECKSNYRCVKCNSRHHVSICEPRPLRQQEQEPPQRNTNLEERYTSTTVSTSKSGTTFLQTAKAKITDARNFATRDVRVLFDGCSQKSFVTKEVVDGLNLPVIRTEKMIVKGFGCTEEVMRKMDVICLRIWDSSKSQFRDIEVYVVPFICSPICNQEIDLAKATYEHLISLPLADSTDGKNELEISVLIGADYYWRFVSGEVIKSEQSELSEEEPVAIDTILGWVLSGSMKGTKSPYSVNVVTQHVLLNVDQPPEDERLFQLVNKFWKLESIGIENGENFKKDDVILQNFRNTTKFDGSNYHVRLPWKPTFSEIHDNYALSRARLRVLLARLRKDPHLLEEYDRIIKNQVAEGIVENVDEGDWGEPGKVYYIPHREVIK